MSGVPHTSAGTLTGEMGGEGDGQVEAAWSFLSSKTFFEWTCPQGSET